MLVSIIIPVHNTEKYLNQCLSSVRSQSYKDWECILIDDGSSDTSGAICDEWTEKDDRFIVYHRRNAGASAARNLGIEKAKGQWLCFIDSDDWVDSEYIMDMVNSFSSVTELVVSGHIQHFENTVCQPFAPLTEQIIKLERCHIDSFINHIGLLYGPCSKLFSTDVVKRMKIKFPDHLSLGEDTFFCFSYLEHCQTIHFLPDINYHYRRVDSSSLSQRHRKDAFDIYFDLWKMKRSFLERHDMWHDGAISHFLLDLWGIVYNGLFDVYSCNKCLYCRIKSILSITEINELPSVRDRFKCAKWIKFCIIHRMSFIFWTLSLFRKQK